MTVAGMVVLVLGTYALRAVGPLAHGRVRFSERVNRHLKRAATVLLSALVATAALTVDGGFAGWALPCGVTVGGVLAWRKAPFIVVVVAAAATTAVLRLLGVG